MNHRYKVLLGTIVATICSVVGVAPAAAVAAGPTIAITTPVEGQHYALNAAVAAAWTCDPAGYDVLTCAAEAPVSTATAGATTFTVNATDAGGGSSTKTVTYVVDADTTAPTITIASPADGQHYALGTAISADYDCDDTGGSGVASCVAVTSIDTTVGEHTFTVHATDGAGNTASRGITYTVDPDTTAPTITITSPADGQHYAPGATIDAAFTCDDAGSGVATCTAASPLDYSVGTHAYTVNAADADGNTASKSVMYTIDPDATPPTISITSPGDGRHYPQGSAFGWTFACDDTGGSGVATCAAATAIDLGVGTHVFTVNATDGAGNAATKSVTYTVDAAPASGGETPAAGSSPGGGTPTASTPTASTPTGSSPTGSASETVTTTTTPAAAPRVTLPARASTTALTRGVSLSLSGLKPRSRVELRVRRGLRTIKVIRTTANSAGKVKLKLRLSRAQLRGLRGKTLTLRFATTAANGRKKVVMKRLKVV